MKLIAEFEILGLPQTVNAIGRKHWSAKVKEAKKWKELVVQQCILAGIGGLKLAQASLELTRCSSMETDFDNLASSFKHVLDGLTVAGVIVDDKPSVIGSPTFVWQKTKPGDGRIRVKIWARSGSTGKDE